MKTKDYIGDGVYAQLDEDNTLVLTTEVGNRIPNRISLHRDVLFNLVAFCLEVTERNKHPLDSGSDSFLKLEKVGRDAKS